MDSSEESGEEFMENEQLSNVEDLFDANDEDDSNRGNDGNSTRGDDNRDNENDAKEKLNRAMKRVVKNPRVILNFERLKSANGYKSLMESFEKFKFKGKHFEKEDLTAVMQNMQHWMCHHLYPGYDVETCMKALEKLGKKRVVQTDMKRMRQAAMSGDWENKENVSDNNLDCPTTLLEDNFDELLREEPMKM